MSTEDRFGLGLLLRHASGAKEGALHHHGGARQDGCDLGLGCIRRWAPPPVGRPGFVCEGACLRPAGPAVRARAEDLHSGVAQEGQARHGLLHLHSRPALPQSADGLTNCALVRGESRVEPIELCLRFRRLATEGLFRLTDDVPNVSNCVVALHRANQQSLLAGQHSRATWLHWDPEAASDVLRCRIAQPKLVDGDSQLPHLHLGHATGLDIGALPSTLAAVGALHGPGHPAHLPDAVQVLARYEDSRVAVAPEQQRQRVDMVDVAVRHQYGNWCACWIPPADASVKENPRLLDDEARSLQRSRMARERPR
mmetsp:Transcript_77440/g.173327  ORF Transcript_77440/g.173327 Transcript_77440/m.173327 type:complete len:311 (+) Transcript_77440:389-1321(+)